MTERCPFDQRLQQRCQHRGGWRAAFARCTREQLTVRKKDNVCGVADPRRPILRGNAEAANKGNRFRGMHGDPISQELGDRGSSSSFHGRTLCEIGAIVERRAERPAGAVLLGLPVKIRPA
jgi:hypothetical protein